MKKILLTFLTIFSLLVFLTGCSNRPDKYVGNSDDETKKLVSDTIYNYDLIKNIFSDKVSFDSEDIKIFNGLEYTRVKGSIFNDLNSFTSAVESTFTKDRTPQILEQLHKEKNILRVNEDKLYISNEYINLPKHIKNLRVNMDSLDLNTKKENSMIVSYRRVSSGATKVAYATQTLMLSQENGKYLVSDEIIKYFPLEEEYSKLVMEKYTIPNNKSTFIASNNLFLDALGLSSEETLLSLFEVFEPLENSLQLKNAAVYNSNHETLENLNIEDGRILNNMFSTLSSKSTAKLLIVPLEEKPDKNLKKIINFNDYNPTVENKNNSGYILIPKYLDENSITLSVDNQKGQVDLYSSFYMGLYGDYNINYTDKQVNSSINSAHLNGTLPDEFEVVNFNKFMDLLNSLE